MAALVEQHGRVVEELGASHACTLAAERQRYGALAADKDMAGRHATEVQRQMEEDVDREVEELKERCSSWAWLFGWLVGCLCAAAA